MYKLLRRSWSYLTCKLGMQFEAIADPAVQLEQAIAAARGQHRLLTERAANILANEKQLRSTLQRSIAELDTVNRSAAQALTLADAARGTGDGAGVATYDLAAEGLAHRAIALEHDTRELERAVATAITASDAAREVVLRHANSLRQRLSERDRLIERLDQAAMVEQVNEAMRGATVGGEEDAPSFETIRANVERRLMRTTALTELIRSDVEASMQTVEQAELRAQVLTRLGTLRGRLGLAASDPATPDVDVDRVAQTQISSGESRR